MEEDAKLYSVLNKPQYDEGCDFVRSLKISQGDKVLDMGCGTGEVTNFIASLVGPRGEVVGVDPDEERIKIAREKFKHVENLDFIVGDSSSELPHENQDYYDLHFSSNAFHWCVGEEKKKYIEKAFQCLKPQGRLAILTSLKQEDILECLNELPPGFLTLVDYKQLFDGSLFNIVIAEVMPFTAHFSALEEFESWWKASSHNNWNDLDPDCRKKILKKLTKTAADGSIVMEVPNWNLCLVADKA